MPVQTPLAANFLGTLQDRVEPNPRVPDLALPNPNMFIEVDPDWLAEHPNVAPDYDMKLEFGLMDNEIGFTEDAAVSYTDMDVIGRSEPYKTFAGVGSKELHFNLQFVAQGYGAVRRQFNANQQAIGPFTQGEQDAREVERNRLGKEAIEEEVIRPARFLDSLKYPIQDEESGLSYPPPPLYLQIGDFFIARCVMVTATLIWKFPLQPQTMLPMQVEVPVMFQIVRRAPGNYRVAGGPMDGRFQ